MLLTDPRAPNGRPQRSPRAAPPRARSPRLPPLPQPPGRAPPPAPPRCAGCRGCAEATTSSSSSFFLLLRTLCLCVCEQPARLAAPAAPPSFLPPPLPSAPSSPAPAAPPPHPPQPPQRGETRKSRGKPHGHSRRLGWAGRPAHPSSSGRGHRTPPAAQGRGQRMASGRRGRGRGAPPARPRARPRSLSPAPHIRVCTYTHSTRGAVFL